MDTHKKGGRVLNFVPSATTQYNGHIESLRLVFLGPSDHMAALSLNLIGDCCLKVGNICLVQTSK